MYSFCAIKISNLKFYAAYFCIFVKFYFHSAIFTVLMLFLILICIKFGLFSVFHKSCILKLNCRKKCCDQNRKIFVFPFHQIFYIVINFQVARHVGPSKSIHYYVIWSYNYTIIRQVPFVIRSCIVCFLLFRYLSIILK